MPVGKALAKRFSEYRKNDFMEIDQIGTTEFLGLIECMGAKAGVSSNPIKKNIENSSCLYYLGSNNISTKVKGFDLVKEKLGINEIRIKT